MFFERPDSGELAVLVHLDLLSEDAREDPREFEELVLSAGGDPVDFIRGSRDKPDARYFIGRGKLDEVLAATRFHAAQLVLFNHALTPSQERNLERVLECRVLDRTGLILDIFAQRARTHEGKLQVELAQLQHMSTRLVRGWTHLDREKGGIGLRGPGESQLETDRRLLRERIKSLTRRLDKVHRQRREGRRARKRAETPVVSLVGYTNAGKSTLFNSLTNSDVFAADQLFATLDPTFRQLVLKDIGKIVLADTVGFIRHLPHKLVEAFKATLEEAAEADLLLHVIDAADDNRASNIEQVNTVLADIDADQNNCLLVYNKIDLLKDGQPRIDRDASGRPLAVWVSARQRAGLELLAQAIAERLSAEIVHLWLPLPPQYARLRSKLYTSGVVHGERYRDDGSSELELRMPRSDLCRLLQQQNLSWNSFFADSAASPLH